MIRPSSIFGLRTVSKFYTPSRIGHIVSENCHIIRSRIRNGKRWCFWLGVHGVLQARYLDHLLGERVILG
jgi:hypothetical protein